jgi:glycosyltransferase involved in cell wall biosynthesis
LKLLQICVEGNTGSTGTIAEAIGIHAINNGWESYIAYGRFPRPSVSKLIRIGSTFETLLHGLESRIFDNHGLGSRIATKRLIKKIKILNPDIIHLHHLHGYYINIEILFKYLHQSKIPVVWTFHDCWSFTGHCTYFDFVGCEKWKVECCNCPQKLDYPKSVLFDNSRNNFYLKKKLFTSVSNLTIVSVSKWLDNLVAASFFKNTNHTIIYNGIDLNLFKPIDFPNSIKVKYKLEDKFVILGVASTWDRRKGFNDFINLSHLLKNDEVIVLVGLNREQMKNLPNNVIGMSRTENRQELAYLFAAADVFLNLSVEETFGLTTAEALSSGTPVIVYNKTASPELITAETGFIVEKGDNTNIIKSIETIKSKGKAFFSDNCRKSAIEKFNINDSLQGYLTLYNQIIKNA